MGSFSAFLENEVYESLISEVDMPMKALICLSFMFLTSLAQSQQKNKTEKIRPNPIVIQLSDSALKVYNRGNISDAVALLQKAIAIDSNCFTCYSNMISFHNAKQVDWQFALAGTRQMIRIRPKMAELYAGAGVACLKSGDSVSAKTYFQQGLNVENSFLDTMKKNSRGYTERMMTKAECLILLDEHEKANVVIKKAIAVEDKDWFKAYLTSLLTKSKEQLLDFDVENENKHVTVSPLHVKCDSLNAVANLYETVVKDNGKALESYSQAIALDPNYAASYYNRGNLYARLGRYDEACGDLTKAKALGFATASEALANLRKTNGDRCK
jgi:tetratricopeptide (TPR) repeat protein